MLKLKKNIINYFIINIRRTHVRNQLINNIYYYYVHKS